jgi:Asp-tRNA(Asn)/Glu-tRNA(Gln) amidotransferase A subunit family amidase
LPWGFCGRFAPACFTLLSTVERCASTRARLSGLPAGQPLALRVTALGAAGAGPPTVAAFLARPRAVAPSPPRACRLEALDAGSLLVSWAPPAEEGGARVTLYHVQWSAAPDFAPSAAGDVEMVPAGAPSGEAAAPLLSLLAFTVSLAAAVLLADVGYGVPPNVILESAVKALVPWDIFGMIIKSTAFGFTIATVSCGWGSTTTGGAKALAGTTPPRDAFTVSRLRAAGAIILAKTNLDEFARGSTGTSSLGGQVLNPYNLEKIPGGSSGGSGVGVTTLMGWVGLGTETGSSIRNPSTKANLVGFSPSEGLVSRGGIIPISITYDRAGPMARNVTDAALVMSVMAGTDASDLFSYGGLGHTPTDNYRSSFRTDGLKSARTGVVRELFGNAEEDKPAVALVDAAIKKLKDSGAIVIDPLPVGANLWDIVRDTNYGNAENRAALEAYFASRGPQFPIKTIPDMLATGGVLGRLKTRYADEQSAPGLTGNAEYFAKLEGRRALRAFVHEVMARWKLDALVYPHETKPVRTIAEAVQEMWRRELGLEVRLTNQELKSTLSARRAGDFQMLRSVWTADYADPTSFLSIFTTANGNNYTGWADSAYDAALFAAARTSELVARNALFNQAERILLDAAPIIPIFHYTHVFLLQPSVRGWNSTVLDHHPYKHVWLESR